MKKSRSKGRKGHQHSDDVTLRFKQLERAIVDLFGDPTCANLATTLAMHRRDAFAMCGDGRADDFRIAYLRSEVFKRYQFGSISNAEKDAAAWQGFLSAEEQCGRANARLHDFANNARTPEYIRTLLLRARSILNGIVGPLNLDQLARHSRFSGGATTEGNRAVSHPSKKWGEASQITATALPYWHAYVRWAKLCSSDCDTGSEWNDLFREVKIVDANKIFTVPKNFEKRRFAAMEPPLNMFFQLGLGGLYKRAAQREGLLKSDAKEDHMQMALYGSATGELVTRDLKQASDTVCCAIIEELWPADHVRTMYDLRTPRGVWEGQHVVYEKISSMGNGFTFEVETLTFYALVRAVCGRDALVSVFGDDIIYPAEFDEEVVTLLDYCGFISNADKSFATGPFRESCGGHYFEGEDVTPFYVEQMPTSLPEVIDLHNHAIEWTERSGQSVQNSYVVSIIMACRRIVPRKYWGPRDVDGVLWCEWDEARPSWDAQIHAFQVWGFSKKVLQQKHDYYIGGLLATLVNRVNTPVGSYFLVSDRLSKRESVAYQEHLRECAELTAHADRDASDGDDKSLFKYTQVTWKERKVALRCTRQWSGLRYKNRDPVTVTCV